MLRGEARTLSKTWVTVVALTKQTSIVRSAVLMLPSRGKGVAARSWAGQSGPMVVLRVLEVDDWQDWRELRLAALRDAPQAFGAKLADWQGDGDTEGRWRSRLGNGTHNLLAHLDDQPAGMVSGRPQDHGVELISLWVASFARGRGVGDALVDAVVRWSVGSVSLMVKEGNSGAIALYRRHGFVDAGRVGEERRMVRHPRGLDAGQS